MGEIIAVDCSQMDLVNLDPVRGVIRHVKPTLIINPVAYTVVDKAESAPELAMRIDGEATGIMARLATDQQAWWKERTGLYHVTAQRATSWFGSAEAIMAHPSVTKKPRLK